MFIYLFILIFNTGCAKNNEPKDNKTISSIEQEEDCEKSLYQLFYTSDFEIKDKYEVRIDEIRNDTIIIKAFNRNNLSDDPKVKQIVESVVGWFIIPPKKDAIYLSLNALDPEEPNFKKIKTDNILFNNFINCINKKEETKMITSIQFTDLFNEGTNIKFAPKDLDKSEPDIIEFKTKLEDYNKNTSIEDFDESNLSSLINNETFFDLQYYTDSSWLQYFITKYKIDASKLNNLMSLAISQEDYNAVKILLDNHYIVSQKDLDISSDTEMDSKRKIQENKTDGYESYLVSKSKIHQIDGLLRNFHSKNHIQDLDGYTNLRKGKGTSFEVLQRINSGEEVDVLNNTGDWFLVQTKEGKKGYVHKSRVK